MKRRVVALAALAALAIPLRAGAEPLRLRGEALAQAQSPVGLLALSADGDVRRWLTAEALLWTGARGGDQSADVLVIAMRARDPTGRGEVRLGRFVQTTGALRPLHLDGAAGRVRLPWWRLRVETFAGMPVEPEFSADSYDWVVGGRVSRALGRWGSAGVAYLHRRERGALADEEVGLDASGAITDWLDLSGRVAFDLVNPGVSEAKSSAAARRDDWRLELFATHRSPSRLLPATSLFSVLGDVASQRYGASARWRAAPRLDLDATAGARIIDGDVGESLSARALLRLDDRGAGALSLEVRRESAPDADWSGVRGAARVPVADRWLVATEAELAVPDRGRGRGELWPWGLAALRWKPASRWEAALALEGSASPEFSRRFDVLARLSRAWEGP